MVPVIKSPDRVGLWGNFQNICFKVLLDANGWTDRKS